MRKLVLSSLFLVLAGVFVSAQLDFKVGANVDFISGDASETHSFGVGGDIKADFIELGNIVLGGKAGLVNFFGKDIEGTTGQSFKDATFLPLVGYGEFSITDHIIAGLDLGYGISLTSEIDGGFVWSPKVGFKADAFEAFVFYKSIDKLNSFGVGAFISL